MNVDQVEPKTSGRITLPPWLSSGRAVGEGMLFFGVLALLFAILPSGRQYLAATALVYTVIAISISMLFGWSGIASFGHAAFFGAGAYTVGLLSENDWSPFIFLLVAAGVAATGAFFFAVLASRIEAYAQFAMLTLVFGQVLFLLTFRVPGLNGDDGIYGIGRGEAFGIALTGNVKFWWYALGTITVIFIALRQVHRSAFGVSLAALRDDPIRAEALGIPVRRMRVAVFTAAGAVAGIGGALYAQQQGIVTPSTLGFVLSGQILIMALLGGIRRFWGPAIGAIIFTVLQALLFQETGSATLYIGLALLIIVLFLREGITSLPEVIARRVRGSSWMRSR